MIKHGKKKSHRFYHLYRKGKGLLMGVKMIELWSEWIKCLNMYKYFCIRIRWSINIKFLSYWAYKVSKYQIMNEHMIKKNQAKLLPILIIKLISSLWMRNAHKEEKTGWKSLNWQFVLQLKFGDFRYLIYIYACIFCRHMK